MQKYYLVYDGRANVDSDDATVLEVIGETSKKKAKKQCFASWKDTDAVLMEYDIDPENPNNLTNETIIQFDYRK